MGAEKLPTMAEVQADRASRPNWKGQSRLAEKVTERALQVVDERTFKKTVRERDKHHCRCCGRKVAYVVGLVPERGEVHHIHGRHGDLRFEDRAAILLCLACHERVTGKVNDRLFIIATKTFRQGTEHYTDARAPVRFSR